MRRSLLTRLFWGHALLFLAASAVSILITWQELEREAVSGGSQWHLVLVAGAVSCVPVLLLASAGWWFTRRSLASIATLTRAAEQIQEDSLHHRIPLRGTGDELDRLATVLNEMMERLEDSFRNVREFTLHASHELKTPLTILRSGFEQALSDPGLPEAHRDRLIAWLDETDRLNRIVSGLTLLTKADAHMIQLNPESLDLAELVTDAANEASILGQSRGLNVSVRISEPCPVVVDRHRIRQLLLNLTDNAVKYNRDEGFVEYRLERRNGQAIVSVHSSGRGIDPAELPHIFDRFFRSAASRGSTQEGAGLGLSIARWIAEAHGGTLTATSVPDHTTLTLQLPVKPLEGAAEPAAVTAGAGPSAGGEGVARAPVAAGALLVALLMQSQSAASAQETHWAFVPPQKPEVPRIAGASDPMDAFIRETLSERGWPCSPEATREEWLRRVSLALTGLPPSVAEIDAFVNDTTEDARERVVDRLLASPHFGERMAVAWLDAARFADTYGRHEDADSPVWPWRDWVIRAFNSNLPYDRFLEWQMAGDLLPGDDDDRILATAFHRLPVQSNESGSDPEEFRWDQIFDRVNTTSTAVLGLTMECARCHDHKYDPFTQRDYFSLAAFFDKVDELGLFSRYTNGIPAPSMYLYGPGQKERHAELRAAVEAAEKDRERARAGVPGRFRRWLVTHSPPGSGSATDGWLPANGGVRIPGVLPEPEAYLSFDLIDAKERRYRIDNVPDAMVEGRIAMQSVVPGRFGNGYRIETARPKKFVLPSRLAHYRRWQPFTFSLWLQADGSPERGVILHRSRAGLDAANRGYELTLEDGRLAATLAHFYPGNAVRIQAAEPTDLSSWRHIAMTWDGSGRAAGLALYVDGRRLETRVIRDNLYKDIDYLEVWGDLDNFKVADADASSPISLQIGGRTLDAGLRDTTVDELRAYDRCLSPPEIALLAGLPAAEFPVEAWEDWFAREIDEACRAADRALTAARREENDFVTGLTEVMVMNDGCRDLRTTRVFQRGDFRQPAEEVEPGTPAVLPPFPAGAPRDRRGLARWLTDRSNPLTARVQVNRIWSMFFGQGLVTTPQDFGVRGNPPVQQKLLDWLAVGFIESGWDNKALCRRIALSAPFRRSSLPAQPDLLDLDPDNQYLARGPRVRLSAEQLRDSALAASGLLVRTIGGPSVRPYQPEGLWEDSGTQHTYFQDHGENLYRRSLYTFWRRTCPPPVMSIFDAPTREFCVVQRQTTMTPLQALALLNDTGFVEAARILATDLVRRFPGTGNDRKRVDAAFRRLTGRHPTEAQSASLTALIAESREYYAAHPQDAADLLAAAGEAPGDPRLPDAEIAATLLMARAVLNSEPFLCSY